MSIRQIPAAHLAVLERVYHYTAPTEAADSGEPYVVWGETGISAPAADDASAEWAAEGVSYYYTRREYDQDFDLLCAELEASPGVSVRPGRISWDEMTRTMIYEINWSVVVAPFGAYDPEDDE